VGNSEARLSISCEEEHDGKSATAPPAATHANAISIAAMSTHFANWDRK
jgi:hypothetical protein